MKQALVGWNRGIDHAIVLIGPAHSELQRAVEKARIDFDRYESDLRLRQ